jgi:hypothetical protein
MKTILLFELFILIQIGIAWFVYEVFWKGFKK